MKPTDKPSPPDCDICADCKDHCDFEYDAESEEWISNCCSCGPYTVDEDYGQDR